MLLSLQLRSDWYYESMLLLVQQDQLRGSRPTGARGFAFSASSFRPYAPLGSLMGAGARLTQIGGEVTPGTALIELFARYSRIIIQRESGCASPAAVEEGSHANGS